MQKSYDPALVRHYIAQHDLQKLFPFDLEKVSSLLFYDQDELITEAGERTNSITVQVEGTSIAYVLTSTNKFHYVRMIHSPFVMGMVCTIWDEPAIDDIRAITPCVFLSFSATPYLDQLQNYVPFLQYANRWMAAHIRQNADHFEPLPTRLADFILNAAQDGLFQTNLTLCADLLETSYRHLLRMLRTLCENGILEKTQKGCYRILDQERLISIQQGGDTCEY